MNRSNRNLYGSEEKSTDDRPRVRDAHFVLGTDTDGTIHHRSLTDEKVYWIHDGDVVGGKIVPDGQAGEYVEAVAKGAGWDDIRYGERGHAQSWARIAEEQERARREEVRA